MCQRNDISLVRVERNKDGGVVAKIRGGVVGGRESEGTICATKAESG